MTVTRTSSGLYMVSWFTDFSVWAQWLVWEAEALNRYLQTQYHATYLAYPPETKEGVEFVVSRIKLTREEVDKEKGPKSRYGWRELPADPPVFTPWTLEFSAEIDSLERRRREIDGKSFTQAPPYPYDAAALHKILVSRANSKLLLAGAAKCAATDAARAAAENKPAPIPDVAESDLQF